MFVYESNPWKLCILESVFVLKKLHDRGFDTNKINNITSEFFLDCLTVLFGVQSVTETEIDIQPPPDLETMDENSEKYYMLLRYLDRDHYHINIKVQELELFGPNQLDCLMDLLTDLCPTEEEIDLYDGFPHSAIIEKIHWLTGDGDGNKITGIWFHFVEPDYWDDVPFSCGFYIDIFIRFWDKLQCKN